MILIAESEEATRESIEMILVDEGYDCYSVSNTESLIRALEIHQCDLIVTDIDIIHADIGEILSLMQEFSNPAPVLVTLSYERVAEMLDLAKYGIYEYLLKPLQFEEMIDRIMKLINPDNN